MKNLITALFLLLLSSNEAEEITLKWGFIRLPPLVYMNENNKPQGSLADMIKTVGRTSNINFEPSEFPNARALFNINAKKVDFAIGVKSMIKEQNSFIYSKLPFAKMQLLALWRKGTKPVYDYEQLSDKDLVLIRAYTYNARRKQLEGGAASYVNVDDHDRAIEAIVKKRGDYALVYKLAAEFAIENNNLADQIDLEGMVIDEYDLYFILDANYPNAREVMTKIENAYTESF